MTRLICILLICIAVSCSAPIPPATTDTGFDAALESRVDSIVAALTLEEKIALFHGNGKFFSAGIPRLGIADVQYADGPLGVREELERDTWSAAGWTTDSASFFPAGGGLSATWNTELALRYGEGIGAETRARGKDYLLAPAVNIQRSPLGGRNYEYFSEDPYLNAGMAVPYVLGVQSQDVAACIKHFAVNNQETNRGTIDVLTSERTLREIYLPTFKAAVTEGNVYSVMGAYNRYKGDYLCENDYLLNQILRKEWGFKGTVISDWGATHSTVQSAMRGLDVEMGSEGDYNTWFMADALKDSVLSGAVSEAQINEMAKRIVRVLLNVKKTDPSRSTGQINTEKHRQILYDVAAESIVLLKNDGGLLPINSTKITSIAVIGDNAMQKHASGGFGAGVKVQYEVSPLDGIKNRLPNAEINYALGYEEKYQDIPNVPSYVKIPDNTVDQKLIDEAVAAAKKSDVAIVFAGSNRLVESEATDRQTMDLPFAQVELIKAVIAANPKTVVVMIAGTPFDLREVEQASSAIIWSWFNGSEAGNALADVITGTLNPSGKLPFTIPKKLEDSPAHATGSFPGDTISVRYDEGILVGYRWFDTKSVEPLFCFGHGLSYATFTYGDIEMAKTTYNESESIVLSVMLNNTGTADGKETVQVYVRKASSAVERADKELKGFIKVPVPAGKIAYGKVTVAVKDLAYFDETSMQWVVEKGEYELLVGSSSRDLRASQLIMIE